MAKVEMQTGDRNDPVRIVDLPGNSFKERQQKADQREHKLQKVVKGQVQQRKPTLGKKFKDAFFGAEVSDVKSYLIFDVLIPSIKATICDILMGGSNMLFFNDARGRYDNRDGRKTSASYQKYYDDRRDREIRQNTRTRRYSYEDIVLNTRAEAQDVLFAMFDYVEKYDTITVADLYDLVGWTSEFTDEYFGWKNLQGADVRPVRDGFLLVLPRPVSLR